MKLIETQNKKLTFRLRNLTFSKLNKEIWKIIIYNLRCKISCNNWLILQNNILKIHTKITYWNYTSTNFFEKQHKFKLRWW